MTKKNPTAHVSIQLSDQPGSLQRLLGTIRRRGFRIENLVVTQSARTDGYAVEGRLNGERSFETLAKHIANLFEVSLVSVQVSNNPFSYTKSPVNAGELV